MSLLDRVLDGDEGPADRLRASAKATILLAWAFMAVFVLATVVAAILSLAGIADVGSPWDRLFPLVILMLVLQLTVVERYRRKRLEQRVQALEAR